MLAARCWSCGKGLSCAASHSASASVTVVDYATLFTQILYNGVQNMFSPEENCLLSLLRPRMESQTDELTMKAVYWIHRKLEHYYANDLLVETLAIVPLFHPCVMAPDTAAWLARRTLQKAREQQDRQQ